MNHNLIEMNRYCNDFHDDERIIFCKIDYVVNEFQRLKNHKNKVVMIIANGDITFDDNLLKLCPDNVIHIFSTNTNCNSDKVTPIPIGVEMEIPAKRIGHGDVNAGIFEKLPYLLKQEKINDITMIHRLYSNFNVGTNLVLRSQVKQISQNQSHIFFEFGVSYHNFVKNIKSHLATISPRGNGIECIRTYEVLYLDSIPIVVGDWSDYRVIYEKIYKNLPIVFVDNIEKLKDFVFIKNEIKKVKNNSREMLDYQYWFNLIRSKTNKIL